MENYSGSLERLEAILFELREKCPWDKKQTIQSLRNLTIEECYELIDAIDRANWKNIEEELGDLLLHILFYILIGTENQQLNKNSVISKISEKLILRHPHVYGTIFVENEDDVKRNWEQLKLKEGKKSVIEGVPLNLPAMIKAVRLQEKAKQVGFEWEHISDVKKKIDEEWKELEQAMEIKNRDEIENEFGDVLFSMVNFARYLKIDPEACLEKTNRKFALRFKLMEQSVQEQNKDMKDMSLEELDKIWNLVKKNN